MRFVVDTHALLWYLQDSPRLGTSAKLLFEEEESARHVVIPTIVLAELLYISRKLSLPHSFKTIFNRLEKEERFEIYPLSGAVLREAIPLSSFEMHDAIIMATALTLRIPLMTNDAEIISSGCVKVLTPH